MKLLPTIAAIVISTATFSSIAASSSPKQVDSEQARNLQSIGVVSVSGIAGSSDDAIHQLKAKATQDGASYYRVIGVDTPGDSSNWRGNAEIYR